MASLCAPNIHLADITRDEEVHFITQSMPLELGMYPLPYNIARARRVLHVKKSITGLILVIYMKDSKFLQIRYISSSFASVYNSSHLAQKSSKRKKSAMRFFMNCQTTDFIRAHLLLPQRHSSPWQKAFAVPDDQKLHLQ
ncbi:hypothetical protein Anapl_00941 [Anas platyrhynchos]|uniref:Uncharacterized protein n=1 Tax=Anas platyrhynchos TaxID=8839 RepID=R0LK67_ANAPL|nr:hypothetical protein Anapl_00941 [Anas platyrhynchos]